ncbi:uncharacterized protein [Clytia hemisphaerica]|uniref:Cnidarian restricted protein n=1 Tax=Clytia hemisphaerica TaxID=252671 RepID=A0A7M5XCF9_9CNID
MTMMKLAFLLAAVFMVVQCAPTVVDKENNLSTSEDVFDALEDSPMNDELDEDELDEEIEDPSYYRRKCRYVRRCRSSRKCSRVRIPVKYSGSKGSYQKPRYELRCKPVRRCRRVRVCRKVRVQKIYAYGK